MIIFYTLEECYKYNNLLKAVRKALTILTRVEPQAKVAEKMERNIVTAVPSNTSKFMRLNQINVNLISRFKSRLNNSIMQQFQSCC